METVGSARPTGQSREELVAAARARLLGWVGNDGPDLFSARAMARRLRARPTPQVQQRPWEPSRERTLAVVAAANGAISSQFTELHREAGVNAFAGLVLLELAWRPSTPLGELPSRLSRPRTTVSSAIRRLAGLGYLQTRADQRDRRRRWVDLNSMGRRIAAQVDWILGGLAEGLDPASREAEGDAADYVTAVAATFEPWVDDWAVFRDDQWYYDLTASPLTVGWWSAVPISRRRRQQLERAGRPRWTVARRRASMLPEPGPGTDGDSTGAPAPRGPPGR